MNEKNASGKMSTSGEIKHLFNYRLVIVFHISSFKQLKISESRGQPLLLRLTRGQQGQRPAAWETARQASGEPGTPGGRGVPGRPEKPETAGGSSSLPSSHLLVPLA